MLKIGLQFESKKDGLSFSLIILITNLVIIYKIYLLFT